MMIKCTQPDRAIRAASSEGGDHCPKSGSELCKLKEERVSGREKSVSWVAAQETARCSYRSVQTFYFFMI